MQTVPPTSEATSATVQQMGVYVKMVTGDPLAIGREIAGQLGLDAGGMGLCAGMVTRGSELSCRPVTLWRWGRGSRR